MRRASDNTKRTREGSTLSPAGRKRRRARADSESQDHDDAQAAAEVPSPRVPASCTQNLLYYLQQQEPLVLLSIQRIPLQAPVSLRHYRAEMQLQVLPAQDSNNMFDDLEFTGALSSPSAAAAAAGGACAAATAEPSPIAPQLEANEAPNVEGSQLGTARIVSPGDESNRGTVESEQGSVVSADSPARILLPTPFDPTQAPLPEPFREEPALQAEPAAPISLRSIAGELEDGGCEGTRLAAPERTACGALGAAAPADAAAAHPQAGEEQCAREKDGRSGSSTGNCGPASGADGDSNGVLLSGAGGGFGAALLHDGASAASGTPQQQQTRACVARHVEQHSFEYSPMSQSLSQDEVRANNSLRGLTGTAKVDERQPSAFLEPRVQASAAAAPPPPPLVQPGQPAASASLARQLAFSPAPVQLAPAALAFGKEAAEQSKHSVEEQMPSEQQWRQRQQQQRQQQRQQQQRTGTEASAGALSASKQHANMGPPAAGSTPIHPAAVTRAVDAAWGSANSGLTAPSSCAEPSNNGSNNCRSGHALLAQHATPGADLSGNRTNGRLEATAQAAQAAATPAAALGASAIGSSGSLSMGGSFFSTAGKNKRVAVSAASLARAARLFQEEDDAETGAGSSSGGGGGGSSGQNSGGGDSSAGIRGTGSASRPQSSVGKGKGPVHAATPLSDRLPSTGGKQQPPQQQQQQLQPPQQLQHRYPAPPSHAAAQRQSLGSPALATPGSMGAPTPRPLAASTASAGKALPSANAGLQSRLGNGAASERGSSASPLPQRGLSTGSVNTPRVTNPYAAMKRPRVTPPAPAAGARTVTPSDKPPPPPPPPQPRSFPAAQADRSPAVNTSLSEGVATRGAYSSGTRNAPLGVQHPAMRRTNDASGGGGSSGGGFGSCGSASTNEWGAGFGREGSSAVGGLSSGSTPAAAAESGKFRVTFSTGGRKRPIQVSEESLRRVERLFECETDAEADQADPVPRNRESGSHFQVPWSKGAKTESCSGGGGGLLGHGHGHASGNGSAGGNHVANSNDSGNLASALARDAAAASQAPAEQTGRAIAPSSSSGVTFTRGRGRAVHVSEEGRRKVEHLCGDAVGASSAAGANAAPAAAAAAAAAAAIAAGLDGEFEPKRSAGDASSSESSAVARLELATNSASSKSLPAPEVGAAVAPSGGSASSGGGAPRPQFRTGRGTAVEVTQEARKKVERLCGDDIRAPVLLAHVSTPGECDPRSQKMQGEVGAGKFTLRDVKGPGECGTSANGCSVSGAGEQLPTCDAATPVSAFVEPNVLAESSTPRYTLTRGRGRPVDVSEEGRRAAERLLEQDKGTGEVLCESSAGKSVQAGPNSVVGEAEGGRAPSARNGGVGSTSGIFSGASAVQPQEGFPRPTLRTGRGTAVRVTEEGLRRVNRVFEVEESGKSSSTRAESSVDAMPPPAALNGGDSTPNPSPDESGCAAGVSLQRLESDNSVSSQAEGDGDASTMRASPSAAAAAVLHCASSAAAAMGQDHVVGGRLSAPPTVKSSAGLSRRRPRPPAQSNGGGGGSGNGLQNRENESSSAEGASMRACAAGLRTPFGSGKASPGNEVDACAALSAGASTPLPSHKLHFASPLPGNQHSASRIQQDCASNMDIDNDESTAGAEIREGAPTPTVPQLQAKAGSALRTLNGQVISAAGLHAGNARARASSAAPNLAGGSPAGPPTAIATVSTGASPLAAATALLGAQQQPQPPQQQQPARKTPAPQNPYAKASGSGGKRRGGGVPFQLTDDSLFDLTPEHQPKPRQPLSSLGPPAAAASLEDSVARGILRATARVTSGNALLLRFRKRDSGCEADDAGVPCCIGGEECSLGHLPLAAGELPGLAQDSTAAELRAELLKCGAAAGLCSQAWVANHTRWIVWKLAGMERSHPAEHGGRLLRFDSVLKQLRYRYEVEVRQAHKSALKAVLQGDASAASLVVLCVSHVHVPNVLERAETAAGDPELDQKPGNNEFFANSVPAGSAPVALELTDGWHTVDAWVEGGLAYFVRRGRISVGAKLAISGASLQATGPAIAAAATEDGEARRQWKDLFSGGGGTDPMELFLRRARGQLPFGAGPCLRLPLNGTRLARWDAPLGFWRSKIRSSAAAPLLGNGNDAKAAGNEAAAAAASSGMVLPLCSLVSGGGPAPVVEVLVHRRYPMLYMEREAVSSGGYACNGPRNGNGNGNGGQQPPRTPGRVLTEAEEEAVREMRAAACQNLAEAVAIDLQAEEKEADGDLPAGERGNRRAAAIYRRVRDASDPLAAFEALTEEERRSLLSWREKRQEALQRRHQREVEQRMRESLGADRRSVAFVTIRVTCLCGGGGGDGSGGSGRRPVHRPFAALVQLWGPNEAAVSALAEGNRVRLHRVGVSSGAGELRLTLNRNSSVEVVAGPACELDRTSNGYEARRGVPLEALGAANMTRSSSDGAAADPQKIALVLPREDVDLALRLLLVTAVDAATQLEAPATPPTPGVATAAAAASLEASGWRSYHIYLTDASGQVLRLSRRVSAAFAGCCRLLRAEPGSIWAFVNVAVDARSASNPSSAAQLLGRWVDVTSAVAGVPAAATQLGHLATDVHRLQAYADTTEGGSAFEALRNRLTKQLFGDGSCAVPKSLLSPPARLAASDGAGEICLESANLGERPIAARNTTTPSLPNRSTAIQHAEDAAIGGVAAAVGACACADDSDTKGKPSNERRKGNADGPLAVGGSDASGTREEQPICVASDAVVEVSGFAMVLTLPAPTEEGATSAPGASEPFARELLAWIGDGEDGVEILLPQRLWKDLLEAALPPVGSWPPGAAAELAGINAMVAQAQNVGIGTQGVFEGALGRCPTGAIFCLLLGGMVLAKAEGTTLLRAVARLCGGVRLDVRAVQTEARGGGGGGGGGSGRGGIALRAVAISRA